VTIKYRVFRKLCNHTVRSEIRIYDEEDFICDIVRPPSDIIVLTVQDDEEDKLHQQIEQVVIKPP
jgi:hypothetical protein